MSSQGFYRGTSHDQVPFFANKEQKMIEDGNWPPAFDLKVDMSKVNTEAISCWIDKTLTEYLGYEDDILIEFCQAQLNPECCESDAPTEKVCPKKIQISLGGFLGSKTSVFVQDLWNLLLSAQDSPGGIPQKLLEDKKIQLESKKEEANKLQETLDKFREQEQRKSPTNSEREHSASRADARDVRSSSQRSLAKRSSTPINKSPCDKKGRSSRSCRRKSDSASSSVANRDSNLAKDKISRKSAERYKRRRNSQSSRSGSAPRWKRSVSSRDRESRRHDNFKYRYDRPARRRPSYGRFSRRRSYSKDYRKSISRNRYSGNAPSRQARSFRKRECWRNRSHSNHRESYYRKPSGRRSSLSSDLHHTSRGLSRKTHEHLDKVKRSSSRSVTVTRSLSSGKKRNHSSSRSGDSKSFQKARRLVSRGSETVRKQKTCETEEQRPSANSKSSSTTTRSLSKKNTSKADYMEVAKPSSSEARKSSSERAGSSRRGSTESFSKRVLRRRRSISVSSSPRYRARRRDHRIPSLRRNSPRRTPRRDVGSSFSKPYRPRLWFERFNRRTYYNRQRGSRPSISRRFSSRRDNDRVSNSVENRRYRGNAYDRYRRDSRETRRTAKGSRSLCNDKRNSRQSQDRSTPTKRGSRLPSVNSSVARLPCDSQNKSHSIRRDETRDKDSSKTDQLDSEARDNTASSELPSRTPSEIKASQNEDELSETKAQSPKLEENIEAAEKSECSKIETETTETAAVRKMPAEPTDTLGLVSDAYNSDDLEKPDPQGPNVDRYAGRCYMDQIDLPQHYHHRQAAGSNRYSDDSPFATSRYNRNNSDKSPAASARPRFTHNVPPPSRVVSSGISRRYSNSRSLTRGSKRKERSNSSLRSKELKIKARKILGTRET